MPANKKFVGVLAQDVQQVAPYMVNNFTYQDDNNNQKQYLDYNPNALFYILVNSVKAQQVQIEDQKKQLADKDDALQKLQNQYNDLAAKVDQLAQIQQQCCGKTTDGNANTGNYVGASLDQNIPNPAAGTSTVIGYYVPQNVANAYILIKATTTNLVARYAVTTGRGQITVSLSDFTPGVYVYELVTDDVMADSKKMVVTK